MPVTFIRIWSCTVAIALAGKSATGRENGQHNALPALRESQHLEPERFRLGQRHPESYCGDACPVPTALSSSASPPSDAEALLTCLPDGPTICASSKTKLVTEGRGPVGLTVAVLPVVTHLWSRRGEKHPEGTGSEHTRPGYSAARSPQQHM